MKSEDSPRIGVAILAKAPIAGADHRVDIRRWPLVPALVLLEGNSWGELRMMAHSSRPARNFLARSRTAAFWLDRRLRSEQPAICF